MQNGQDSRKYDHSLECTHRIPISKCHIFTEAKTKLNWDFFFLQRRNQHEEEVGYFEEIGFEQFLMVMSHFRPPTLKTTEEEKEVMRKEKLRCKKLHFHFNNTITRQKTGSLGFQPKLYSSLCCPSFVFLNNKNTRKEVHQPVQVSNWCVYLISITTKLPTTVW